MADSHFTPLDLKTLRNHRRMRQLDLANLLNIGQVRISNIECDPGSISVKQWMQYLGTLGFSVEITPRSNWENPLSKSGLSSVYILPHKHLQLIKVGKANDAEIRAAQIGEINFPAGYRLQTASESDAFKLEKILHRSFHTWRLTPDETPAIGVPESGYTEWFRNDCLPRMLEFLRLNEDIFGCKIEKVAA